MWLGCAKQPVANTVDATERGALVLTQTPLSVLETEVRGDEPGHRGRALALIIRHVGSGWGPVALADPSPWVQRQGIEALGAGDNDASRALLEDFAAERDADPYVRGLAAQQAGTDAAAETMRAALRTETEGWRVAPLALALLRLGDPSAREPLARALAAGELALEVEFVLDVGRSGDALLLAALRTAEERVEPELVLPVAAARLMLGDAAAEAALRKAVSEGDVERRLEAVDYLTTIEHPAAEALLRRAMAEGPEIVTWYARLALAAHADDDNTFVAALGDPDPEVRAFAATLLRSSVREAPRLARPLEKALEEALGDADPTVRAQAARAAGELRLTDLRSGVAALFDDHAPRVRIEAAGAFLALDR